MKTSSSYETLQKSLLPLIPLWRSQALVSHGTHQLSETQALQRLLDSLPQHSIQRWDVLVKLVAASLSSHDTVDAACWLQRAHAWKNRHEAEQGAVIEIRSRQWITLSACSIAVEETDSAAAFAIRAWESSEQSWREDLLDDCVDSRADSMSLLAIIRVCQRKADRAVTLLERSSCLHRQVGDVEQLAADLLLESLCHETLGQAIAAEAARREARSIVNDSLDETRHTRTSSLRRCVNRFGQKRPRLLKQSEML